MLDNATLEWFFAPSPRPAPALRPRPPAVVSTVASVTATMPVDILELILKHAWLSYANAPRLAAVDHSFKMANDRAAFELEDGACISQHASTKPGTWWLSLRGLVQ